MKRSKKVRYWIVYRVPGGKQRWEPVGYSVEEARDAEGKRRGQKRENRIFDIKPETKMTFNELTEWFLSLEKVKARAYYPTLKYNLASFNAEFGNMVVSQIKPADLENYQATQKKAGYSDSYVDQQIGAARTMIYKAFDNDLVGGDLLKVFRKAKKLLKRDANRRDRVVSYPDEYERLIAALPYHTKPIVEMAFWTGMRRGEIMSLSWDKVDLEKRMIQLEAKDRTGKAGGHSPHCTRSLRHRTARLYGGKGGAMRKLLVGTLVLLALAGSSRMARCGQGARPVDVVVLGIDGMDPRLLQRFIAQGRMPNFERLIAEGSFSALGTSTPPQSPVAWSSFITGMDPGGHAVFDFIHRDPQEYLPTFSASRVEEPKRVIRLGPWIIPLTKGKTELLRRGTAFWQLLTDEGIPAVVFRIPSNFPPVRSAAKAISGMGTPDLLGTYGTFSYFTDDPTMAGMEVSGGKIYPVEMEADVLRAALTGPKNTMRRERPVLKAPFTLYRDAENRSAKIVVGDEELILEVGQWSRWIEVKFPVLGPLHSLRGICRFYLKSLEPHLGLYVSPINIDPLHPALPISDPPGYSRHLYSKVGFFYTQGMAEDTKALEWGVLDDGEFLAQADIVFRERMHLLGAVLDDYRGGFLFFYFSTLDQCTHMLWRNLDRDHPAHNEDAARYAEAVAN
ncbi:MAG: alkaline phosphatase family protein, partial [Thermodesulfobacteriota bacterium]